MNNDERIKELESCNDLLANELAAAQMNMGELSIRLAKFIKKLENKGKSNLIYKNLAADLVNIIDNKPAGEIELEESGSD